MTVVADARRFADMHALYRMYDERGRLLYVGITGDLGKRLGEHSVKRWFPLVEKITLEWKATRAQAVLDERRTIAAEHPRYNQAGLKPAREPRVKAAVPVRRKVQAPAAAEGAPRDLLADVAAVIGEQRVKLRDLASLLRDLAPGCPEYQKLNGVRLGKSLRGRSVRTINTSGVHYLDPADFRKVADREGR